VDVPVSSDDSEILISYHADSSLDFTKFNITLAVGFKFGSLFPEMVGIYDSVKTTSLTLLVSEFKSDITFQKTAYRDIASIFFGGIKTHDRINNLIYVIQIVQHCSSRSDRICFRYRNVCLG
jgi:hypothetical protein